MPFINLVSLIFFSAIIICWVFTFLIRQLAIKWNVLDYPADARKIHQRPMPLLGGWAIYLTLAVIFAALAYFGQLDNARINLVLIGFFLAGLWLAIGGFLDDAFGLRWYWSLLFPLAAIITMIFFGLNVSVITNPLGGYIFFDALKLPLWSVQGQTIFFAPISAVIVFVWLLTMVYTTKLLDGLDGLASSISLIASITIFIVSLFWDQAGSTTSFLSIALAGALIGFLVWNWHPAKIFLGESGSTLLGFTLGVLAILTGGKFATALLVMGVPMLDVVWVMLRRLFNRQPIFALADTGHLHFRLLRLGLKQPQVVIVMSVIAMLFGSTSFFVSSQGKLISLSVLVLLMIIGAIIIVRAQHARLNH